MENAARALEIAAGVLLGVLLMAAVSYFFSNIGEMPTQQDDITSREQLAEFNKSYEAFNKSGMYGVDVLSCLNKAKSNNEKYVDGNKFLSGNSYGKKFMVDIYVHVNTPLEESLEIYRYDNESKNLVLYLGNDYEDDVLPEDKETIQSAGIMTPSEYNKKEGYTKLELDMDIIAAAKLLRDDPYLTMSTLGKGPFLLENSSNASHQNLVPSSGMVGKNYYSLIDDEQITNLLNYTDTMKVTKFNIGDNKDVWNSIVWSTALYSFKTKRFKCDYMEYHEETGRVSKIYFSEI